MAETHHNFFQVKATNNPTPGLDPFRMDYVRVYNGNGDCWEKDDGTFDDIQNSNSGTGWHVMKKSC